MESSGEKHPGDPTVKSLPPRGMTATSGRSFLRQRLTAVLVAGFCLGVVAGCATHEPSEDEEAQEAAEMTQAFRQDLGSTAKQVDTYLVATRNGTNVSQMSLGWLAYTLLNELADQDAEMGAYFHQGERDVGTYLKRAFAAHPAEEVAALDAMSRSAHPALRMIARDTLEALRWIPDGNDPPEIQAKDRALLATALGNLKARLEKTSCASDPL